MKNSIFRKKIAYLLATAVISGGLSGVVNVDLYASTIENNKASSITDNMGLDRTTPSTIISQVADILTIAEVRAAKEGEAVKTKGVVTRVNGKNIYIEDETAGMYIYGEADNKVKEGDEIIVSGNLKNYNGLLEIVAPKNEKIIVTTLSNNNVTTPQVITIKEYTDNTDKYESRLIRIAGITLGDIQTSGYTTIEDHTGESEIYKAPKGIQEGYDKYDVIGVGARYNNRFYLTVVDAADIIPTDGMLGVEDIIIKVGETFTLPQTIEVLKDGIATNEKITWNQVEVDAIDNSKSGIYEVNGIVEANHRAVKVAVGIASNEQIRISDIQGESHQSPLINQPVADVEGIVTIVEDEGFYMQSETPDDDDATSEGIYVAKQGVNVQVGKVVKVSGIVEEKISPSTNANMVPEVQLTTTQLTANKVEVLDTKVNEIKPIIIGEGGRVAPNKIIDNDAFEKFDPEEDAIDFYESLEGMLVQVNNALVVGANKYDEIPVVPDRGIHSLNGLSSNGGVVISEDTLHPEIITLAKGKSTYQPKVMVGDVFTGGLQGILGYNDGNYKIFVSKKLPEVKENTYESNPQTTLKQTDNGLRIASFNVENLGGNASSSRFKDMAVAIAHNLEFPDIIALQEVQDNSGSTDDKVVEGNMVYEKIIKAIEEQPGSENIKYDYIEVTPINNEDGGAPGGNIRVGMIYRTDRVQLVPGTKGDSTTATKVVKGKDGTASLTLNPGRVEPQSPMFKDTRKSLAAEFLFNGEKVIVINNHLSSKGGDDPLFGNKQPYILHSEVKRIEQARVINNFVKEILEVDSKAKVVVIGDMNDYQFSNPVKTLEGNELYNMINKLEETERYSYSYQGKSQILDNVLVSKGLEKATDVEIIHINSTKGKGVQISDHDPAIIRINMDQIKVEDDNPGNNDHEDSDNSTGGGSSSNNNVGTKPEFKPETNPSKKVKTTISLLENKAVKDGKEVALTVVPFLEKGRVIAGIRDMSTILGIDESDIVWDNKTKTIMIKEKDISITVGKTYALVKGEKLEMGVAPKIVKGRVILPIAHIGRILGMQVEFDSKTKLVTIIH